MSALVPPPPAPPPPEMMIPVYGGAEGTAVRGSYGPVIAMLAFLAVLAAVAVAVGRFCFGRRVLGQAGGHDLEAWVERTCGSCVGASMFSPGPAADGPAKEEGGGTGTAAVAVAAAAEQPPEGTERGEGSGSGTGGGGGS